MSIGGATYDLFVRTGKNLTCMTQGSCALLLPLGEKIRVERVIETCGGGACNTAIGLRRLGCDATIAGIIGSDQWGEKLLGTLKEERVRTDSLTVVSRETTSFSIILSVESGERVILYEPGTNAHLHDVTFDRSKAATMDWIYLNHIHESTEVIEDDLLQILSEKDHPGLTWNPGGKQIAIGMRGGKHAELLTHTNFLLLNKGEALAFTQSKTVEDALRHLLDAGVHIVCVTDGKNGATASDGTSLLHCPILPGKPVDTTGAGDAFGAGATWAILSGLPLRTALIAGTMNSNSVIGVIGAEAGLLTDKDMASRLASPPVTVDVLPFP